VGVPVPQVQGKEQYHLQPVVVSIPQVQKVGQPPQTAEVPVLPEQEEEQPPPQKVMAGETLLPN